MKLQTTTLSVSARLNNTAGIFSVRVIEQNEAYTSKTCTSCGKINHIGSKKIMICSCGATIDRDINGARNIFLRALGDTPSLETYLQCALVS